MGVPVGTGWGAATSGRQVRPPDGSQNRRQARRLAGVNPRTGAELAPPTAEGRGAPPRAVYRAELQARPRGSEDPATETDPRGPGPDGTCRPRPELCPHMARGDRPASSAAFHMAHKATHSHCPSAEASQGPPCLGEPSCPRFSLPTCFCDTCLCNAHEHERTDTRLFRRLCGLMMAGSRPRDLAGSALLRSPARQPEPRQEPPRPDLG